jgi:hypothetical protein
MLRQCDQMGLSKNPDRFGQVARQATAQKSSAP